MTCRAPIPVGLPRKGAKESVAGTESALKGSAEGTGETWTEFSLKTK